MTHLLAAWDCLSSCVREFLPKSLGCALIGPQNPSLAALLDALRACRPGTVHSAAFLVPPDGPWARDDRAQCMVLAQWFPMAPLV